VKIKLMVIFPMEKMMLLNEVKKIPLIFTIILSTCSVAFSKDTVSNNNQKELLIFEKGIGLYENEAVNSKKIRNLDFLEKVYLLKNDSQKRIFVVTEKNEKGWVDSVCTSLIPPNWKKIGNFDEVSIQIPQNLKFSIKKGEWVNRGINVAKEDKIFVGNFFVLINRSNETFAEILKNYKEADIVFKQKSIYFEKNFKGENIIFNLINESTDFTQEYSIIVPYKKNSYVNISVSTDSQEPTYDEIRTTLKILFSYEIK